MSFKQKYDEFIEMYKYDYGVQINDIDLIYFCFMNKEYNNFLSIIIKFIKTHIYLTYNDNKETFKLIFFSELYYLDKVVKLLYLKLYNKDLTDNFKETILEYLLKFITYIENKEDIFKELNKRLLKINFKLSLSGFGHEIISSIDQQILKNMCINYDIKQYIENVHMNDNLQINHNIRILNGHIYVYIDETIKRVFYSNFKKMFIDIFHRNMLYIYNIIIYAKLSKNEKELFNHNKHEINIEKDFQEFYDNNYKFWILTKEFFINI